MQLTRERKILLTVVAIGLAGLTLDRLVLGTSQTGPQAASAFALSPAPSPSALPTQMAMTEAVPVGPSVAERLSAFAQANSLSTDAADRDAFAPDTAWVPLPLPAAAPSAEVLQPGPSLAEQFRSQHRLMAVMLSAGQTIAIVDGRPMHVGQRLDGMTLVRIEQMVTRPTGVQPASATFASEAGQVELTLHPAQ